MCCNQILRRASAQHDFNKLRQEQTDNYSISYTTHWKEDFAAMQALMPDGRMEEFLDNTAVGGNGQGFKLDDLTMIDKSVMFLVWLSKGETAQKDLIGMHTVGYFVPFKAAVLNLTVIFGDYRGQKNLDSFNKVIFHFVQQSTHYIFLNIVAYMTLGNNGICFEDIS